MLFGEVFPQNSREIGRFFREFVPKNLAKFDFFPRPIRSPEYYGVIHRSRYTFGGKLALFMRFGTFSMMKAKQDNMKCLF